MSLLKGPFNWVCDQDCRINLTFDSQYVVYLNSDDGYQPIGPMSSDSRYFSRPFKNEDDLWIETEGKATIHVLPMKNDEPGGGEQHVEILEDHELSMYDRLRAEMLDMLSAVSETKGHESFDEANDLEDEEDTDTPLTPYEFHEMHEEYLKEVKSTDIDSEIKPEPEPEPEKEVQTDPEPESELKQA